MNEVNAIVTTEAGLDGSSVLLAGREAGGQQDAGFTSSPPLAGGRCPTCEGYGLVFLKTWDGHRSEECPECQGTGQRSGPANKKLADQRA